MTQRLLNGRITSAAYPMPSIPPFSALKVVLVRITPMSLSLPVEGFLSNRVRATRAIGAGYSHSEVAASALRFAQGKITEGGVPVSRRVCVYDRETKALAATCMSGAGGAFSVSWKGGPGDVFVLIFDDEKDTAVYNAKVFDFVTG